MAQKLFEGYTKTGKAVRFDLEDGHIFVVYTATGVKRKYNDERYSEDDSFDSVKLALLNDGYRIK